MKRLICLLLALATCIALLPMTVFADQGTNASTTGSTTTEKEDTKKKETKKTPEQLAAEELERQRLHLDNPNKHNKLSWNCNTKYHWKECSCGLKYGIERHDDPKETADDICTCGYHFSANADLVTLWVNGCPGIKDFNKKNTEYTLHAYTYKDVKSIKISTRTHDSQATVELPEDLTLKTGTNTFPVKVTAENQKVTKTYTLTIIKD